MNIFVLHEHPGIAAEMLCDCHVRKMITESAQLLYGVAKIRKHKKALGLSWPRMQNMRHPVLLALNTDAKVNWLLGHLQYLLQEFSRRFGKSHAYEFYEHMYIKYLWEGTHWDHRGLCKCCGDLDVANLDIVTAYRRYYIEVKKPMLQAKGLWKFTNTTDWTEDKNVEIQTKSQK